MNFENTNFSSILTSDGQQLNLFNYCNKFDYYLLKNVFCLVKLFQAYEQQKVTI